MSDNQAPVHTVIRHKWRNALRSYDQYQ